MRPSCVAAGEGEAPRRGGDYELWETEETTVVGGERSLSGASVCTSSALLASGVPRNENKPPMTVLRPESISLPGLPGAMLDLPVVGES